MQQPAAIATPTPPPPPQQPGRDFGDAIKDMVDGAVSGALAGTRAELQREVARLEIQREALLGALSSTESRPARLQIQGRIDAVERELEAKRTALEKIERQLRTTDRPTRVFSSTAPPPNFPVRNMDNFNPAPMVIAVVAIMFIGFPIALTLARFIWKRSTSAPAPALGVEQSRRFDRLEQSVDAIAIEVERISENQRYLTKLLASSREHSQLP